MPEDLRSRLIAAGAATLADALLGLAERSDVAAASVARLTSSPEENIARYLRRLDALAPAITDWRGFSNHATYVAGVRSAHGRKVRFWQRYDEAGDVVGEEVVEFQPHNG